METANIFGDPSDLILPTANVTSGNESVTPWVLLDVAQRQAASRIAHELSIKHHQPAEMREIRLSRTSEQLVLDNLRSGSVTVPDPETGEAVDVAKWTKSANFVFETLKLYGFADSDIKKAMVAANGAGDITDMLAWLCFNVAADKMPADMRDKLEQNTYKGSFVAVDDKPSIVGSKSSKTAARADQADDQGENDQQDMVLSALLEKLGFDDYASNDSESDEDPGIVHARRSVRLRGLSEWLDVLRARNKGNRHRHTLLMLQEMVSKEKRVLADIEQDFLFNADQSSSEFNRLWPEYYDALLRDMLEFKRVEQERLDNTSAQRAAGGLDAEYTGDAKADSKSIQKPGRSVDIFDEDGSESDSSNDNDLGFVLDFDFGSGFGSDSRPDAADRKAYANLYRPKVVDAIDTAAPRGWKGALVKTILGETVRHRDSIADIRFTVVAAKNTKSGFTSTLKIEWSALNKAAQHVKQATRAIPGITSKASPLDAQGQVHVWKLPEILVGKTKRDAENLVSLVWLFSQTAVPLHMGTRLSPVLRELWSDWAAATKQAEQLRAAKVLVERAEFLQSLRERYDASVARKQTNPSMPAANSLRIKRPRTLQHAVKAKRLRQLKWSSDTIKKRCAGNRWKEKFGKVQSQLPARQFCSPIVQCISQNRVTIVRGETGSGKSSQVPQFVLQMILGATKYSGGKILCTQPRRISAVTIAERVSQELGDSKVGTRNSLVGYQIRFDARAADQNALVFCTTGVLLRILAENPLLEGVSCVVCDEVQERTLELDYLLIVLRRLLSKRSDLKLVLMSATIDTTIFAYYFDQCPVVEIPGRTFPVHNIYLENIVQMVEYSLDKTSFYAEQKSLASQRSMFVTTEFGRGDCLFQFTFDARTDQSVKTTEAAVAAAATEAAANSVSSVFGREIWTENEEYVSPAAWSTVNCMRTDIVNLELIHLILHGICAGDSQPSSGPVWPGFCHSRVPKGAVLVFLPGIKDIRGLYDMLLNDKEISDTATIVPLHSSFANDRPAGSQMTYSELAFYQDNACRKIVLSTNVAETGITIPDITIVIDSGKSNQARYDGNRRLTHLETLPISKANVKQRQGRAGRVQPGLSICLFTKSQYEQMRDFELPEMRRLPLINLCLLSKAHGVRDIMRFLQDALDPPPQSATMQAIHELQQSGALDEDENLTPIGHHLCYLPLDLPVAKLLVMGALLNCLDPVLTLAASMSLTNGIITRTTYGQNGQFGVDSIHSQYRRYHDILPYVHDKEQASDLLVTLAAYEDWRQRAMQVRTSRSDIFAFCKTRCLSLESLEQLEDFREQYLRLLCELGLVRIDRSMMSRATPLAHIIRPKLHSRHGFRAGFVKVPVQANVNGENLNIIYAAIVAALDHIVMPSVNTPSSFVIGQTTVAKRVQGIGRAIQIVDRERVATRLIQLHSHSVIGSINSEARLNKENALIAASLSGTSSKTFAHDVTKVNLATVLLFARTLEYWPKARQITINRWIVCKCFARTTSVLMLMRRGMHQILEYKVNYPTKPLPENLARWQRIIINVLSLESV